MPRIRVQNRSIFMKIDSYFPQFPRFSSFCHQPRRRSTSRAASRPPRFPFPPVIRIRTATGLQSHTRRASDSAGSWHPISRRPSRMARVLNSRPNHVVHHPKYPHTHRQPDLTTQIESLGDRRYRHIECKTCKHHEQGDLHRSATLAQQTPWFPPGPSRLANSHRPPQCVPLPITFFHLQLNP